MGRIHRLRGWGILPPAKPRKPTDAPMVLVDELLEPGAQPIVMGVDPAADAPPETFHPAHGRLAVEMPPKRNPLVKLHPRSTLERLLGSVPDPILAEASKEFMPVAPNLVPARKRKHQSKWRRARR